MTHATDGPPLDGDRAAAFAERLGGVLNDASLALMLSLGHRVGLLDAMAGRPPTTSEELALAADLNERYVREWLGAMTTGRVVDYDPATRRYHLPPEHAVSLGRSARAASASVGMQYIPLLAAVEPQLVECFRHGGGVPYAAFGTIHEVMAEDTANALDAALLDAVVPLVPGLADRLREGIDVADVGCGSGHAINLLARAFPASRFVGYDFTDEAIGAARREAEELGLENAAFEVRDAARLGEHDRFDLVTAFDTIHDQARPAEVLSGIGHALRDGGVFLMVDVRASSNLEDNLDHALGTFLYTVSTMHCMTVSLALGGAGLGTVWGEQLAVSLLGEAGFSRVDVRHIEGDAFNTYYVARKA